jgi:predicted enzyme related to lactoylglutathione lyase
MEYAAILRTTTFRDVESLDEMIYTRIMGSTARLWRFVVIVAVALMMAACNAKSENQNMSQNKQEARAMGNPVFHFEIPVNDMSRAKDFYEGVFGYLLTRQEVDGYDMAFFPRADGAAGASGALAKGDAYKPSKDGAIIYFDVPDIDVVLRNAKQRGSKILYEQKDIGEAGFVAEFEDSEGNRVALSQVRS